MCFDQRKYCAVIDSVNDVIANVDNIYQSIEDEDRCDRSVQRAKRLCARFLVDSTVSLGGQILKELQVLAICVTRN